jgi:hypothetical protein
MNFNPYFGTGKKADIQKIKSSKVIEKAFQISETFSLGKRTLQILILWKRKSSTFLRSFQSGEYRIRTDDPYTASVVL